MKPLIAMMLILVADHGWCQSFQKKFEVNLPDSVVSARPVWADMNNDGLLDILLEATAQSGSTYLMVIKGDTIAAPILQPQKTIFLSGATAVLTDYNHDNKIDIVACGTRNASVTTRVYINKGGFSFEERTIAIAPFQVLKIADLDNDAREEWIISGVESGVSFLRILKQTGDLTWGIVHDSLSILASSIDVTDGNKDGLLDIFVTGKASPDSTVTTVLVNKGSLFFRNEIAIPLNGLATAGDFNYDGSFDFLIMGTNQAGSAKTGVYESASGKYAYRDLPVTLKDGHPFAADLNSDGKVDFNYWGIRDEGDTINIIQVDGNDYDTLASANIVHHRFGDASHDGDLDLLLVTSKAVEVYENKPIAKNLGPATPKNGIAVPIFDRMFVYWDKVGDDHTVKQSVTYDLHLEGNSNYYTGAFDLLNEKRLLVSHGNNGTENFRLLKNVGSTNLQFAVQAIDNAFHAGGLCIGSGQPCTNLSREEVSLCTSEKVTLKSPSNALWFSFSKGFIGEGPEFSQQAQNRDTVFYYDPGQHGCSGIKVWTIAINDDTLRTNNEDTYACMDENIQLSADAGWAHINWKSKVRGDLGSSNTIQYIVTQPDSVSLTVSNDIGCKVVRTIAMHVSKPDVQVSSDRIKIAKGSSVKLAASGAERYTWDPADGLDHADVSGPTASPMATTLYTVTGYDSLNCTSQANVNIIVEDGGFIPNLFTPNDDGKNDQLRIYGLTSAKNFLFTVYNREGSIVFKTTDISEAITRGWDGTKNGAKQASGVYFWKVKGEVSSGDQILLNGKDTGSVVLVR
ncbi:MAG TPA: gliding motility-associated C-terminal domain-containing protein [Chryseolinea sp.]|nr:gliding motility-associated C-terminal domain-containing protein [Chryseolinea sp.]